MIPYLNHVVKTCDTRDLKLKVSKWMTDSAYKWRPSWFCSSKLCETNESRSHLINAYAIFFCIASEHIWANSRTNLKANIKLKFNGVFLFLISKKKMLLDFINEISELFFCTLSLYMSHTFILLLSKIMNVHIICRKPKEKPQNLRKNTMIIFWNQH